MAVTGVSFLIKMNTGTEGSPVYTTVAGNRNATLNMGLGQADITSKDSAGWEEHEPTNRNWSIDFDGLFLETDTGVVEVKDWWKNKTKLQVQMLTEQGATFTGYATVELQISAPHDDAATISGTLRGSGALTEA